MLLATRRGRPNGCFGYRSCGKGVFFRFCRPAGCGAADWESFAAGTRDEHLCLTASVAASVSTFG